MTKILQCEIFFVAHLKLQSTFEIRWTASGVIKSCRKRRDSAQLQKPSKTNWPHGNQVWVDDKGFSSPH